MTGIHCVTYAMTGIYCVTYAMTATTGIVSFTCLTFMYNFVQLNAKID